MNYNEQALLEVRGLRVVHGAGKRASERVIAVDDVSLSVFPGEWVGLVGESGCGKSSVAQALTGQVPPAAGSVTWRGEDVTGVLGSRKTRRRMQMIFQDVSGALNPRLTIAEAISEVLSVHRLAPGAGRIKQRVAELLQLVGLPVSAGHRYPHEFSGGQRQRISIARALAVEPELLIADEPVSALDVSVQVQIIDVLRSLRERRGLAGLLIAHDLAVVGSLCARVYVMYLGRIMEWGPVERVLYAPRHPYTRALLAAVPDVERGLERRRASRPRELLEGDVPSRWQAMCGCPFQGRCPLFKDVCRNKVPDFVLMEGGIRGSACWFAEES